ncbi:MAG: beta-N-acetylhexosaminidase [Terriglobia bacterium]
MTTDRQNIWRELAAGLALIAFTLANGYASPLSSRGYTVLPQPQQVELKGGDFEFGSGWRLELGPGVKASDVSVESLKEGLSRRYGVRLDTAGREHGEVITLTLQPGSVAVGSAADKNKAALAEQAYKLQLTRDHIRITANAPAGLFYGVETLVQLVKPAQGKLWLPIAVITDWPDLENRFVYWDDSHHLDRFDVLKNALRQAAFYKVNGFAIKLNGHFEYQSAPAVVEPYALSPEQVQELTNYGLKYHIQLIPYIDGPAHIDFILKHPEYASLRAFPDSNYELCTANPNSYKLIEGMYQDLLNANRGVKYFVLSTDEPYYVGLADNAQCREAQRAKELGSRGKVLAEYLTKTAGYLHSRGRQVIFWAGYPMVSSDIPSLPSYLITRGINYNAQPGFAQALEAHGIRGMIRTAPEGAEPLFPSYYLLPSSKLFNPVRTGGEAGGQSELDKTYQEVSFAAARKSGDVIGVLDMAWGDEGLHPATFWLGYITGCSWGWRPGSPGPNEAASDFFKLFYGPSAVDIGQIYQLMSTQAEFWNSSWDEEPSSARKPIFGNSSSIFHPRHPAHDQTLPLPPVPQGEYLSLPFDWSLENARRVTMAEDFMPANDELANLLHTNLHSVEFHRYNLETFLSIAGLYRQNLEMLEEMGKIDGALKAAQAAAAQVQFDRAVAALDRALDLATQIRNQRNAALRAAVTTWYESWYPRVEEANGRRYLEAVSDVKDHLPARTVDMSYLVYRETILPFGQWFDQVEAARNRYAHSHNIAERTDKLGWKQTGP